MLRDSKLVGHKLLESVIVERGDAAAANKCTTGLQPTLMA